MDNKTLILNDFFTSCDLDLLCITETWLMTGDTSLLSELLLSGCKSFNCPCTSGRGGGFLSICKDNFKCNRFELQMLKLEMDTTVAIAVLYHPPRAHKDFLNEFANFLVDITSNFDKMIILGDFNIHVCPLANSFAN